MKPEYGKYFPSVDKIMKEMQIDTQHYHIDLGHWDKFNSMRDEGRSLSEIGQQTEIHESLALMALEYTRLCIMKYNGNEQKLRDCMEGRI